MRNAVISDCRPVQLRNGIDKISKLCLETYKGKVKAATKQNLPALLKPRNKETKIQKLMIEQNDRIKVMR